MKRIAVVQFKVYSKPQFKHPREVRFVDNGDHDIDYYVAKVKADVKYGRYVNYGQKATGYRGEFVEYTESPEA